MCDYCGCRSVPVIQDLGAEHEALEHLAASVRRAISTGDHDEACAKLARLVDVLHLHTKVEEASVFASLRAAGEMGDYVDALVADHDAVRQTVAALADRDWDESALRLLDDLHDHIGREEYDLFPATLLALGPADWARAEEAAADVRGHGA